MKVITPSFPRKNKTVMKMRIVSTRAGGFPPAATLPIHLSLCFHLHLFFLLNAAKNWEMWQTVVKIKVILVPAYSEICLQLFESVDSLRRWKFSALLEICGKKNESSYTIFFTDDWLVHYGGGEFYFFYSTCFLKVVFLKKILQKISNSQPSGDK